MSNSAEDKLMRFLLLLLLVVVVVVLVLFPENNLQEMSDLIFWESEKIFKDTDFINFYPAC